MTTILAELEKTKNDLGNSDADHKAGTWYSMTCISFVGETKQLSGKKQEQINSLMEQLVKPSNAILFERLNYTDCVSYV